MLLVAVPAAAGQQPSSTTRGYTVFLAGTVVGREEVTVQAAADGTTITGKGRLSGTLNIVMNRAEVRYRADWTPESFDLEATVNGGDTTLQTIFNGQSVVTRGVDGGQQIDQTDQVPAPALVIPNVFFGAYEALTRQLTDVAAGREFSVFLGAGRLGTLRLTSANNERMQVGTVTFDVRRYALSFTSPGGSGALHVYADEHGSLLRVNNPAQRLDILREDLASAAARTVVYSNPGDEAVNIPAAGFTLGATITRPTSKPGPLPAVILFAGAGIDDRDGVVAGVPLLGQIAAALADAGFLAVRFDKRGYGQSGGRAESATLGDHADDALAALRWLGNRTDVDRNRIAVLGHNEGAWTAMLAATRERRIAGVITIASPATRGVERILEQQRHALERMSMTPTERVAKIELQARINTAVIAGRGWEGIPADMRRQADTPWFQSLLTFDPARVIKDLRQPLLIVHGEIDAEVPIAHQDRLAELAKASRSTAVAVVSVRGVNHLLLPAVTGDVSEYASLGDRHVSADVTTAITDWLAKTFAAIR